jgi:hypothetical protein
MIKKTTLLWGVLPIVLMAENSVIGNGSIMASYKDSVSDKSHQGPYPFGITKDMTILHIINNKNVGFFQWFINSNSCDKLKIYTTSNSQKVNITVGPWSSRDEDRTFKNVSLPFIIGKENVKETSWFTDDSWLVTGIEFLKETSSSEGLYAECTEESATTSSYKIGQPLMLGKYRWNGNGSIISGYFKSQYNNWSNPSQGTNPSNQWPFGIFKDISIVHPNIDKQIVFFQHLKSDVCSKITLDVLGANSSEKKATLMYKDWNGRNYTEKSVTLPYTLSPDNLWTVVGLKFDTHFSKAYQIEASCSTGSNQESITPLDLNHKSMKDVAKHPNGCNFDDVDNSAWYAKYVKALCLSGIVQGYGHTNYTKYGPGDIATWAELTKVVNLSNDYESTFEKCRNRVNGGNWYECYINIAENQGFYHSADTQVRRGLALQYFAKVFFNKTFNSWSDAGNFFKSKGIINGVNNSGVIDSDYLNSFMNRAELAKIALNSTRVASDESSYSQKKELPYGLVKEKLSNENDSIHNKIESSQNKDKLPKTSIPKPPSKNLDETSFKKKVVENAKKTVNKKSVFSTPTKTSDVDYVTTLIGKGVSKEDNAKDLCDKFDLKDTGEKGDMVCYQDDTPGTKGNGHVAIVADNQAEEEIGVVKKGNPIQKRKIDKANVKGYVSTKKVLKE